MAKKVTRECVTCFRFKCEGAKQLMASLPAPRVTISRPFQNCGLDYTGPFLLKTFNVKSRLTFKAYIAIFICYSTKAVHFEIVSSLSTSKCIEAIQRFCDQRGRPQRITSDCGRNFVGARKELKELEKLVKSQEHSGKVTKALTENQIEWHTNPPYSPHFGSLWESGIKSLKYHLRRVVGNQKLTYEELLTVVKRAEAILNSRPLTELNSDPNDFQVLTPAHFLTGDSLISLPEPIHDDIKLSHRTKWQHMQRMMQTLWRRWSREYLTRLQNRPKWWIKRDNVKVGDLVLLREDNVPALKWKLGRITEIHPGSDGLVRAVTIRTEQGTTKRAIAKISPLPYDS